MKGIGLLLVGLVALLAFAVYSSHKASLHDRDACLSLAQATNEGVPVTIGSWTCIGVKKAE